MPKLHLKSKKFHQAIVAGCKAVILERQQLNSINIFPVADGDTGDNMASMASAIITYSVAKESIDDMLRSVADASVIGARGNSGIIFSQFFNSLAEKPILNESIDIPVFSDLLRQVILTIRKDLTSPIDGTILTMIEAFASQWVRLGEQISCFNVMMTTLLPLLKTTLEQTKETLPILKKAQVVDAGALGFYYFLEGFADCLANTKHIVHADHEPAMPPITHEMTAMEGRPIHRYCTEAVLMADLIDKKQLAHLLEQHGDCVALTGNERLCRFHVHTNKPWDVFTHAINHGTVGYPKVDDMLRQFEVMHDRKHTIALVTDSSADIPQHLKDHYQIHIIPLNIHLDDHNLLDRYSVDPTALYQKLNTLASHPKTSCPSPVLIEEKLRYLSSHYEQVVVLSLAKVMSGTFEALTKASLQFSNVSVIDSRTNSGAHGLLLHYAGDLICAGYTHQALIQRLQEAISNSYVFVMINTLESMIRSGRMSHATGRLGQLLRIKPIVSFDQEGKGIMHSKAFNAKRALTKIIKTVQKLQRESGKKIVQYCIVHAGVQDKAEAFAELTTAAFQQPPAYIESASTAIGLHAGYGCIELAVRMGED